MTDRDTFENLSEHTPGPWELLRHAEGDLYTSQYGSLCVVGGDKFIADVTIEWKGKPHRPIITGDPGEQGANARLIAAAPDLLAALKALLRDAVASGGECWCSGASPDYPSPPPCPACVARAAIAGAEGGAR